MNPKGVVHLALAAFRAAAPVFRDTGAEIAHAEALFAALTSECFDLACTDRGGAMNGSENLNGDVLRNRANISFGPMRRRRSASRGSLITRDLFHRETQLSNHFIERNARVALKPFLGSGDGALLIFRNRFVVDGSVSDRGGYGIVHHFEQPGGGLELTRVGLVGQLMGVSFVHAAEDGLLRDYGITRASRYA